MEFKKELKYPIKYAIMTIKEPVDYKRDLKVVAHIVSKCYVISQKEQYFDNGTYNISYEVVFPCTEKNSTMKTPEYNIDLQCMNSSLVNQLFDTYEDALIAATQMNEDIFYKEIGYLPLDQNFNRNVKNIKTKHQENLEKYKQLEKEIQNRTITMQVSPTYNSSLEELIEKMIENPQEFYIKIAKSLSKEEREYLKKLINNKSCMNCTNKNCRVEYSERIGLDDQGKPQGNSCLGWNNPELIGRKRILTKNV